MDACLKSRVILGSEAVVYMFPCVAMQKEKVITDNIAFQLDTFSF